MISNCSIDERGKITGGKDGDNNGKEWRIRSWYSYPWNVVLHHPDARVRELLAQLATDAAKNDAIGYNQNRRLTFWNELKKVNYQPAAIKVKCASDCSAGVAALVKAVGYLLDIDALKEVPATSYTGNLKANLKKAGFEVLTASKYRTSDKYIYMGDILLKEGRHTCINLTTGAGVEPSIKPSIGNRPTVKEWQLAAIADGFKLTADGKWGAECEKVAKKAIVKKRIVYKYHNLTKLVQKYLCIEVDGKCGNDTKAAIKAYQKQEGLVADGECGINTWEHILNV